ncbi:MAG: glycoside hydrolase, partial [Actinomycetota bacterium]|nr:glycoside hydrolase [Actinomycetota bacterium]
MATAALIAAGVVAAPTCLGTALAAPVRAPASHCPAPAALRFAPQRYVDTTRAGGEPLVATYPNGRIVYSSHAGTTHFFAPAAAKVGTGAFVDHYQGQTYIWTSDDNGRTWTFRPRTLPGQGAPMSGFSDPDIAIDSSGAIFFSEINLANVAVSRSTDKGSTYSLQNVAGAVLTDRQWMAADRKDELYMVANGYGGGTGLPPSSTTGHYIAKSTDGGKTFTTNVADATGGTGFGPIRADKRTGTVYEAHAENGRLSVAAFRKARSGNLTDADRGLVAEGVQMLGHWPDIELDPSGHVYITWDESGHGGRPAGIWYSRSVDAGRTWARPVRVNTGSATAIWPWLGVGDDGRVGVAWLQADHALPTQ